MASPARAEDFEQSINTTPDAFPPALGSAGTHPCIIATSAGFSITGLGIAGGSGFIDEGCEHRNYAALLFNIGEPEVAKAYLCMVNPDVAKAFETMGKECFEIPPSRDQVDRAKGEILAEIFRHQAARDK